MSTTIQQTEGPGARVVGPGVGAGRPTVREARRGWILATLCLVQLMISLDVLIVNVALPSAQRSLGFGIAKRAGPRWTLARGELPGHEVISSASRPQFHQGALRGNGQPS